MTHSYVSILVHCVFSTAQRAPLLEAEARPRVFAYLGGIARENDMIALSIGGVADHVHVALGLHQSICVADAMKLIKGRSSGWITRELQIRDFSWQEGYGAFSIGISQLEATRRYIEGQEQHHRRATFQDEYRAFLEKHGIHFEDRYLWD